jgi:RsiW-degrading membrane proteinase PrsW (M82 family)
MPRPEPRTHLAPHPWVVALALLAAIGPLAWFAEMVRGVPGMIVLAAVAPALLYAWGIVRIDRHDPEPRVALVAALLGGAVIAA